MECWNVGILEDWNVGMLECWKIGMLECWNVGIMEGLAFSTLFTFYIYHFKFYIYFNFSGTPLIPNPFPQGDKGITLQKKVAFLVFI